jgi:hypothetical protein
MSMNTHMRDRSTITKDSRIITRGRRNITRDRSSINRDKYTIKKDRRTNIRDNSSMNRDNNCKIMFTKCHMERRTKDKDSTMSMKATMRTQRSLMGISRCQARHLMQLSRIISSQSMRVCLSRRDTSTTRVRAIFKLRL